MADEHDRVLVWAAAVDAAFDPAAHWRLLDGEERDRASRFVFERDRAHFVAAHALKRLMLTSVCGGDPRSWTFVKGRNGKPALAGRTHPFFNISHCRGLVACGVSTSVDVGVDVEPVDRVVSPDLTQAVLSKPEAAWLGALEKADQPLAFTRLWTLKEAFIKATGRGLEHDLQAFSFDLDPIRLTLVDRTLGSTRHWSFEQQLMGRSHVLSVAAYSRAMPVDGIRVEIRSRSSSGWPTED